jgi:hypothetical protein
MRLKLVAIKVSGGHLIPVIMRASSRGRLPMPKSRVSQIQVLRIAALAGLEPRAGALPDLAGRKGATRARHW